MSTDLYPTQPVPKPRRLLSRTLSTSLISIPPKPKPRTRLSLILDDESDSVIVKLRDQPPSRPIGPLPTCPESSVLTDVLLFTRSSDIQSSTNPDDSIYLTAEHPETCTTVTGDEVQPEMVSATENGQTNLDDKKTIHRQRSVESCSSDSAVDLGNSGQFPTDAENDESIQIQMEDITCADDVRSRKNSGDSVALASATSEFVCENMMRIGPEWTVPDKFSDSVIVKELAESDDQRPRPPSACAYSVSNTLENEKNRAESMKIERCPSLLEKIIRSHTIWYLPHIGRPIATHLLRNMEPGNFIVRSASRPSCMAISVRLPQGHELETDHYIVVISTKGVVRLENSPFSFTSLPYLLEHYCKRNEELQVKLSLPVRVMECQTTTSLQSIALLGQDFWTSDMSLSRSASRTSRVSQRSSIAESSTSFMGHGGLSGATSSFDIHPNAHYAVNDQPRLSTKKRSSGRSNSTRFATIHGDLLCATAERCQSTLELKDKETNSPPTKHERADGGGHLSRSGRRSQSVRAAQTHKAEATPTTSGSRRSFLKSLFSREPSATSTATTKRSTADKLAQCQIFVPYQSGQVKSTRSAYDIGEPLPLMRLDWQRSNVDRPLGSVNGSSMKSFKPIHGYDEVLAHARVRPIPMRRERSDLCASSAIRLARHTEGSPGPAASPKVQQRAPMRPPSTAMDAQATRNCVEELRRKRLQSTNEMLHPTSSGVPEVSQSATNSPHISMRNTATAWPAWRQRERDHRLSVPNLVEEPSNAVIQTAKALKEKLGRTHDGELGTINEGLITPVVRRKLFSHHDASCGSSLSSSSSSDRSDSSRNGTVARGRETLKALFDQKPIQAADSNISNRFGIERRSTSSCASGTSAAGNNRESDLIWRRTGQKPGESTASKRNSGFFGPATSGKAANWSAVNSELKNRQKISKVRPNASSQSQQRIVPIKMTPGPSLGVVPTVPNMGDKSARSSEYAQLSEFNGLEAIPVIRDDDTLSVAGTVFNEPWDSNVWENLLDLAHHGDDSGNCRRTSLGVADAILEEDSDSDRTAGGSTQMVESEEDDEDEEDWYSMNGKRALPSDRIIQKGWDTDSKYSTMDSRLNDTGSIKAVHTSTPPNSIMSLPRSASRFSHSATLIGPAQVGSLDDLPTTIPTLTPMMTGEKFKYQNIEQPGAVIQQYVERLSCDTHTIFGATLRRFIECTVESDETDPNIVVRNVRQFINGMKNYLVKHGEGDLHQLIEHERNRLNVNQILSIDAILEAVLHKLLLKRVKPHLYHLMVCEHSRRGSLEAVASNIAAVRAMSLRQLGFSQPEELTIPSTQTMEQIKLCLRKMQNHYSPLKKLENLLRAISLILMSQRTLNSEDSAETLTKLPPADDLVRWLVFILARTSTVGCEVEAWYMWELLPQHMLTQGDSSYHLTALFSAVHILKSMDAIKRLADKDSEMINSIEMARQCCTSPSGSDAFLKVAIPDVNAGCIRYATFPGVPQMSTGRLCRVIAHHQGITNPDDYGLYIVLDGFETVLQPADCPDAIRDQMREQSKNFLFAYKRHDAKIAWPHQALSGLALC